MLEGQRQHLWKKLRSEISTRISGRYTARSSRRPPRRASVSPWAGPFGLASYTGHLRNTKDLDVYILPDDRAAMIQVVGSCGLEDYHAQLPDDRGWIYRSHASEIIVDVIWGMPNRRVWVDHDWLTRGPAMTIRGYTLQMLPVEELIWAKMYVIQRERCDWPDILNLIFHAGRRIDWNHLLGRIADDRPVLASLLSVFAWLWETLGIKRCAGRCGARASAGHPAVVRR
jgi:hypothetical protein